MKAIEWSIMRYVRGGGCASKIGPGDLSTVLCGLKAPEDDNVLAGLGGFEDAGVYRLTDAIAIVQTVDFLTPVVKDPYSFGAIAAANALSDVYAMGAIPKTAMNMVCFSPGHYDLGVLKEIIRGGIDKMKEAGVSLIGGHSVDDVEIKYGLAVTGVVRPDRIVRNEGARAGDLLVLTKPLGTGILITAIKEGLADGATAQKAIEVMAALNSRASQVMQQTAVHAATDVTGFGLIGHLSEMIKDSIGVDLFVEHIPCIAEATRFLASGVTSGGLRRNREFYASRTEGPMDGFLCDLLYDPQTSGGLIFAVDPADRFLMDRLAREAGLEFPVIGVFTEGPKGKIVLR
ncbi:MAG: Selenide, water dikinase [Syntrophorhabdus sp. PtaU1.Bin153]|nr:MAG: Selenide, water dikinase [Syntrophorhabdus sp. PtaU1.Bin153]